ncbi:MAG TPA: acyltransferase [Opitutaceae bacterium]|jgi:peptidoglycan/LPS O-acetylase OafA/YrhL
MQPRPGNWLNTLRGLAASAVVFFHLNEVIVYAQEPYRSIVKAGWLGVPVFFVISGYVITAAALRQPDGRSFSLRRWWRIYPPYLASLGLVIAVIALRKVATGTNDVRPLPHGFGAWLATLTLTTDPVTSVPTIDWVYWTLSCEAAFYLAYAIILFTLPRRLAGAAAALSLVCLLPGIPGFLLFFAHNWWQFALGATLALGARNPASWTIWVACAVSAWQLHEGAIALAGVLTAASIAFSRTSAGNWLNREPYFAQIGLISYSLYLIHTPLGVYLYSRLRPLAVATNFPLHLACDIGLYLLCVVSAWVFWRLVENPAHQRGRRIIAKPAILMGGAHGPHAL